MDFSPWDWANTFRLHEAACLIVGVRPLVKLIPDREELPPEAIPIALKLSSAYVEWLVRHDKPERPDSPKIHMLEPSRDVDGSPPQMPAPIKNILGELVSRAELCRWLSAIGMPSKYSFAPRLGVPGDGQDKPETTSKVAPVSRRWTDEFIAEVRSYREAHGLKATAEHYGVSQSVISRKVPAGNKKVAADLWSDWRNK
jgi:hypothetical protein